MAIRQIRTDEDPILRKISREVKEVDDRIKLLLNDMVETMYGAEGVGIAAPQIGILRRLIIVDDRSDIGTLKMVNPVIKNKKGDILGPEGCLSVPNRSGYVNRPESLTVEYIDENGEEQILEAEGLLARIISHEVDHLNGRLYTDIMVEEIFDED